MTDKQRGVLRGVVAGLAITLVVLGLAIAGALPPLMPGARSPLAHAFTSDTLVLVCLAVNIGLLARHRFFTPDDIDGGGLTPGTATAHRWVSLRSTHPTH